MIVNFDYVSLVRGDNLVLNHINWQVQPGENWAVLGLNGAGKTSMLKLLHGDFWPSEGSLEVLGERFGHTPRFPSLLSGSAGFPAPCKTGSTPVT